MVLSVLMYVRLILVTGLYCLCSWPFLLLALLLLGRFQRRRYRQVVRFFIVWYGKTILYPGLWPFVKIQYKNCSGEPPGGGIYILNHRSASDPFLVAALVSTNVVQAVNSWPMRLPFFGFFARQGGYYDITALPYEKVLAETKKLLQENVPIMVFPEGTRSGNREIQSFHGIFFRIAQELDAPLIPVAVAGNENIPNRNFRLYPGKIRIHRLPQIAPETVRHLSSFQLKNHARKIILQETRKMDEWLDHEKQR